MKCFPNMLVIVILVAVITITVSSVVVFGAVGCALGEIDLGCGASPCLSDERACEDAFSGTTRCVPDTLCADIVCTGFGGTCKSSCLSTDTEITGTDCSGSTPKCCLGSGGSGNSFEFYTTNCVAYNLPVESVSCIEDITQLFKDKLAGKGVTDLTKVTSIKLLEVKSDDMGAVYANHKLVVVDSKDHNCGGNIYTVSRNDEMIGNQLDSSFDNSDTIEVHALNMCPSSARSITTKWRVTYGGAPPITYTCEQTSGQACKPSSCPAGWASASGTCVSDYACCKPESQYTCTQTPGQYCKGGASCPAGWATVTGTCPSNTVCCKEIKKCTGGDASGYVTKDCASCNTNYQAWCDTCCNKDCTGGGGGGGSYCGDGICDAGERQNCPQDCGSGPIPMAVAKTPLLEPTGMAACTYTKKKCNQIDDTGTQCTTCGCTKPVVCTPDMEGKGVKCVDDVPTPVCNAFTDSEYTEVDPNSGQCGSWQSPVVAGPNEKPHIEKVYVKGGEGIEELLQRTDTPAYTCGACECLSADDGCWEGSALTVQRACVNTNQINQDQHIRVNQLGGGVASVVISKNLFVAGCAAPNTNDGPWNLGCLISRWKTPSNDWSLPFWINYCQSREGNDYRTGCVKTVDVSTAAANYIPSKTEVSQIIDTSDYWLYGGDAYRNIYKPWTKFIADCPHGCANGICNSNPAPTISSAVPDAENIAAGNEIIVTGTGSDDYAGGKIKLVCTDIDTSFKGSNTPVVDKMMSPVSGCALGPVYTPASTELGCVPGYRLSDGSGGETEGGLSPINCLCEAAMNVNAIYPQDGYCPYGDLIYVPDGFECPTDAGYQKVLHDPPKLDSCKCDYPGHIDEDKFIALCEGEYADENPTCTIPSDKTSEWETGEKTIYCRIQDENQGAGSSLSAYISFTISIDNDVPHVRILEPPAKAPEVPPLTHDFTVVVEDADEGGSGMICEYQVYSNGMLTRDWTERQCNTGFIVAIGKERDCGIGTCRIIARASDMSGNTGSDEREFYVNYIFSYITDPDPNKGRWHGKEINIWVTDTDNSPADIDTCQYRIVSGGDNTKPWTQRTCNSNFTVSIGPEEDCRHEGIENCWVFVKAKNNVGEEGLASLSEFNISWTKPYSEIISPSSEGWQTDDFDVYVSDEEYLGVGFESCEYRVFDKGVLVKEWTERACGQGAPAPFILSVGEQGECSTEGAGTCNVSVRAKAGGNYGNTDNRSFSIMLSDADINGFTDYGHIQTESGVSFWGIPKLNPFTPVFRACNAGYSTQECKSAFTIMGGECGFDKPCLCGAYNKYDCDIICGDRGGQYYLLASGYSGFEEKLLVSNPQYFSCPDMGLDDLEEILAIFKIFNQTFSTQMYKYDYLIRATTDPDLIEQYTLMRNKYREALLITSAHISYLEEVVAAPTVSLVQAAIQRSYDVMAQLRQILSQGYEPTLLKLSTTDITGVRYNTTADIPFTITKTGSLGLFANMTCELTDPGGTTNTSGTGCIDMTNTNTYTHHVEFNATQLGIWTTRCELYGSINTDCRMGIRYDLLRKSVLVYPSEQVYIIEGGVTAPSQILNGSTAEIKVNAHNPDIYDTYAKVLCSVKDPDMYSYTASSSCMRMYEHSGKEFNISMVMGKVGTWEIPECRIYSSTNADCTTPSLTNVSQTNKQVQVILPDYVYITKIDAPRQVMNNTNFDVKISVNNPVEDRFVSVSYIIRKPDTTEITKTFDCTGMPSGGSATFTSTMLADKVGTWQITEVSVMASQNADCSAAALQQTKQGPSINVARNMNLTILSVGPLTNIRINTQKVLDVVVDNPLTTDRFGYVRCIGGKPNNMPYSQINEGQCTLFRRGQTTTVNVKINGTIPGTWTIDSCSVYGAMNNYCTGAAQNHVLSGIGSFDVVTMLEPYITSAELSANNIMVGQEIDVLVNVTNPEQTSRYVKAECMFSSPDNLSVYKSSSCVSIGANSQGMVTVSITPDKAGTWSVPVCSLNVSTQSSCGQSSETSQKTDIGTFAVTMPDTVFISSLDVPENVQNGTSMNINANVYNPLEDMYGQVTCNIQGPDSVTQEYQSSCTGLPSGTTTLMQVSVFVDRLGVWDIEECYIIGSPDSDCSSTRYHNVSGPSFNSVRETNLTILSVTPVTDALVNTTKFMNIEVDNPLPSDKYAKVVCTLRKPDAQTTDSTSLCYSVAADSTRTFSLSPYMDIVGEWGVESCKVYASPSSLCTAAELHDTMTGIGSFNVSAPDHLVVSSVTGPTADVTNNTYVTITASINNPIQDRYAIVDYIIEKPDGTEITDSSLCTGIISDSTRTFTFNVFANQVGTWAIKQASVRASSSAVCSGAALHHNVTGPLFNVVGTTKLTIISVGPLTRIKTGRAKTLNIPVTNPLSVDRYGQVECSITKPNLRSMTNVSECAIVPASSQHTFGIDVYVDVPGTWDITSCTVKGSLNSDCSTPAVHQRKTNIGSFIAIEILDPYMESSSLSAGSVKLGQTLNVNLNVTNPDEESKYVKAQCKFRDPDYVFRYAVSPCSDIPSNASEIFTVSLQPDKIGTWNIPECSLNVSSDSNCIVSAKRSTKENIGTFSATEPDSIYITSIVPELDVILETDTNIKVNVRNPLEPVYSHVRCRIKKPSTAAQDYDSVCRGIPTGTTQEFEVGAYADQIGEWDIIECYAYSSSYSDCSSAVQRHTAEAGSYNVVRGTNLTILSVSNLEKIKINSTKTLAVAVRNPSAVEKSGRVTCSVSKPNTQTETNRSSCHKVLPSSTYDFGVNFRAEHIGTWDVLSCYVEGTLNTDCTSSTIHDTISNPGSYDAVSEFNLTIKGARIVEDTVFINNYILTIIDVRNPDDTDKYATVECEFRSPYNKTYTNLSRCEWAEKEHEISQEVKYFANVSGTWKINNCTLSASDNIACSPSRIHAKKENIGLVFVRVPELMITRIVAPQASLKVGETAEIDVHVKSNALSNRTTYVNCSIMDPTSRTHVIVTPNRVLGAGDTEIFKPSIRVGVPGAWTLLKCAVYKVMSPATKEHEISVNQLFNVLSPAPTECAIDTDCPGTNAKCYCSGNECKPCAADKKCQNNECVSAAQPECITDTGCPAGHICQYEKCVRKGECTFDAHCQTGYKCSNFNCIRIGDCVRDSDCNSGYLCSNYKCVKEEVSWFDQNIVNFIIIILIIILIPVLLFSYAKRSI